MRNLFYFLKPERIGLSLVTEPDSRSLKRKVLLKEVDYDVINWLSDYINVLDESETSVLKTSTSFNVDYLYNHQLDTPSFRNIVNLKRINDTQEINHFFSGINKKLPDQGYFIGCVETQVLRKQRILAKFPAIIGPVYYFFDFLFKRVFPKVPGLRAFYMFITDDRNKAISKAETLGRLYFNGFKVIGLKQNKNLLYFVAEKVHEIESSEELKFGFLIRMKRNGKNGIPIYVYKVRTMHSYSEYLQEYIYENNRLRIGGKFRDDFRISTIGRFLRKVFIDEIPMFLNVLKGDIKLVGVRPVSKQYLSLYTEELQLLRKRIKPGLIPPFYADMPETLNEIMDSEKRYLEAYLKNPVRTDIKYLFKSLFNILMRGARSN